MEGSGFVLDYVNPACYSFYKLPVDVNHILVH